MTKKNLKYFNGLYSWQYRVHCFNFNKTYNNNEKAKNKRISAASLIYTCVSLQNFQNFCVTCNNKPTGISVLVNDETTTENTFLSTNAKSDVFLKYFLVAWVSHVKKGEFIMFYTSITQRQTIVFIIYCVSYIKYNINAIRAFIHQDNESIFVLLYFIYKKKH